jgi:Na+/H+ antiporter NhaA
MVTQALKRFLGHESAGGVVLGLAASAALVASNSGWAPAYEAFRQMPGELRIGDLVLAKPLLVWVNDLWMAVFFFLVGLEIKREFVDGDAARMGHPGSDGHRLCAGRAVVAGRSGAGVAEGLSDRGRDHR